MACLGERLTHFLQPGNGAFETQSTSVNIETLFDIQYRLYSIPTNPDWDQSSVVFSASGVQFGKVPLGCSILDSCGNKQTALRFQTFQPSGTPHRCFVGVTSLFLTGI